MKKAGLTVMLSMLVAATLLSGCSGNAKGQDEGIDEIDERDYHTEITKSISKLRSEVNAKNVADYDFTDKAMAYLEYIGTKLPNRDSLDANGDHDAARDWIIFELKNAGYTDAQIEKQAFPVEHGNGVNLILTVEGEDPSHQIIVGGHYDGDGTGDNGSGIALILANAAGLVGQKPHYTVKYIFFDCEEIGCLGSGYYAGQMTDTEVKNTLFMINIDAIAFGDYCNIYGGDDTSVENASRGLLPMRVEGYNLTMDIAETLGFKVMGTDALDGYFARHGTGPDVEEETLYTNPWTYNNQPPKNFMVTSPATIPASDHVAFNDRGIEYIYFEATNWFVGWELGDEEDYWSYTGYYETYDDSLGLHGMFMNTEYDTWENLNQYFPGRAEKHFRIYSPLLSALIMVR